MYAEEGRREVRMIGVRQVEQDREVGERWERWER